MTTPAQFGGFPGTGVDASAAIGMANAWNNEQGQPGCLLLPGTYTVNSNLTLNNPIEFAVGASLYIGAGATVTINNKIISPLQQIFSGPGTVVINPARSEIGYPEYFGAVPNNIAVDSLAAIDACITAFPIIQFQRATYYISNTAQFTKSGKRIQGMPERNPNDTGTTIEVTSATLDTILVGSATDPGSIGAYPHNIDIFGIYATRSIPPVAPPSDTVAATSAWRVQYGLAITIDTCIGDGSPHGFTYWNVVGSYFTRLNGRISCASTGPNQPIFDGHYLNGFGPTYLASCYFTQCTASYDTTGYFAPTGMRTVGSATDIYINQFEADDIQYGFAYDGAGATKPSIDFYLTGGIFDQITGVGVSILNVPPGSAMHINKSYNAPTAAGVAGIQIINCLGAVTLSGNQTTGLATYGAGTVAGLKIVNSVNVNTQGNIFADCFVGTVVDQASLACTFRDTITQSVYPGGGTCFQVLNGSNSLYIQPSLCATTTGVALDSTITKTEVNCSGIAKGHGPGALYQGGYITAPGPFGPPGCGNVASGVVS